MKNLVTLSRVLLAAVLLSACTGELDPLAPGVTDGEYALGIKALMPLVIGNHWTYNVVVSDTAGAEKSRYTYTLSVLDTVTADTGKIPLVPPATTRGSLTRAALVWYLLRGELDATTCWQVDTLENLRFRKSDDQRFYEQIPFNFRAAVGDTTPARYRSADTTYWASGDVIITTADSVRTTLVSKGDGFIRTTLGSAPFFHYRQSYVKATDYTDYYFKPGFGLVLMEKFQRKSDGTMVRIRRDELVSYFLR
jgi:hypothetical protein